MKFESGGAGIVSEASRLDTGGGAWAKVKVAVPESGPAEDAGTANENATVESAVVLAELLTCWTLNRTPRNYGLP